jgi:hypothetical protein
VPCFTPVESPESNGMAEAFVKTFQARLCPGQPDPGCRYGPCSHRLLDGGRASSFPAGLPLTPGVSRSAFLTRWCPD